MCILDGNAYEAKCADPGMELDEDLESCALLQNNKTQALLVAGQGGSHTPTHKVAVQLVVRVIACCAGGALRVVAIG